MRVKEPTAKVKGPSWEGLHGGVVKVLLDGKNEDSWRGWWREGRELAFLKLRSQIL